MFLQLYSKEIRNHLQTFRFGAALITIFTLVIMSSWVLGQDFLRRMDTYNKMSEKEAIESTNTVVPSRIAPLIHYPPSPLGIFAQGEDKRLGSSVQISRWSVPRIASDSLTDNVLLNAQKTFDFLTILTFIVSLFAVLLSYDSVCGEKENGTLKLISTYNVSKATIYSTKFLACLTVIVIPLIFSFVSALIVLQFVHGIAFHGFQWLALGLMLLNGIVFGAVFVAVGLMSSVILKRSSTALVLALLIWSLGVWLIPLAATNLASALYELPSPNEIDVFERVSRDENVDKARRFYYEFPGGTGNHMGSFGSLEEKTVLFDGNPQAFRMLSALVPFKERMWQDRAERIRQLGLKHDAEMKKQVKLKEYLSMIAPAHHLHSSLTALAATNYRNNEVFIDKAQRFRREILSEFNRRDYFGDNVVEFYSQIPASSAYSEDDFQKRRAGYFNRANTGENIIDIINPDAMNPLPAGIVPAFSFQEVNPQFEASIVPLASIVLEVILFFIIGFVIFLRFDVR